MQEILKEIEELAAREGIPIVGPIRGRFLGELIRKHKPLRALEIGTAIGYSAILIAANLPPGGRQETVELSPRSAEQAARNLQKAGLEDKVSVITGDALTVVPTLSGPYDFVFIDARKRDYRSYLKVLEEKIVPGGLVVADNVKKFASSLRDYLNEVKNSPLFESGTVDFGFDAMEVSVRIKNQNVKWGRSQSSCLKSSTLFEFCIACPPPARHSYAAGDGRRVILHFEF